MKPKELLPFLFVIVFACLTASAQNERAPQRIAFARGATVARATGYLRVLRDCAWFVLRLGAGQHMSVEVDAGCGTHGQAMRSSGKRETEPGAIVFSRDLIATDGYTICVTESTR